MGVSKIALVLIGLLLCGCGAQEPSPSAIELPDGWRQLTDRSDYLPAYEKYINRLPDLPLPLSKVFLGPDSTVIYQGIVVGQRAERAAKFICRADSCSTNIATSLVTVSLLADSTTTLSILLADEANNATYLLAIIGADTVATNYFPLLQSFMHANE